MGSNRGCYRHSQYFFRAADADVEKYLKLFTLLPLERIGQVMQRHNVSVLETLKPPTNTDFPLVTQLDPPKREAQRLLADEVTELVHGCEHRPLF